MKTFLCEYIHPEARKVLASFSEIVSDWDRLPECDAAINRNLQMKREFMEKAPNLKVIAMHGTGLDSIDLEEAKARGIQVFNTPYLNAASVAELNITLMLMAARKVKRIQNNFLEGASFGDPAVFSSVEGNELGGKTAAFIGVGEIAKKTIKICKYGFDMHCIGWSRSLTKEKAEELGIGYAGSITEAVKTADFVVLGMALNEETRGIIGEKELASMKQGAILINTARGALIDEDALLDALTKNRLSAGLDVVVIEPITNTHPLCLLPNVVLTPHIGANTEEALYRVGMACALGIQDFFRT
jgi:D-3-phosphoglycerate dehydrogenase